MSALVIALKEVFSNTSNPRHFLDFPSRARPLQLLLAPVEPALNVRLLVGEPGIGKSALLARVMKEFQSTALTARLCWTQLGRAEFLHHFLQELGVPRPAVTITEAQKQLASVLEGNFSRGRQVLVVVDEAHRLRISTLRAVAELLDCPLGRSNQLRIILAGLPALKVRTASPALQEFNSRISEIAWLGPLTFEESCSYITQKQDLSRLTGDQHFSTEAITFIAKLTGIPGDINNLCLQAVYRAQQRGYKSIDEGLIAELAAEEGIPGVSRDAQEVSTEATVPLQGSRPRIPEFASVGFGQEFERSDSHLDSQFVLDPAAVFSGPNSSLSSCISDWFGDERLAWAGTTGELAVSLQQAEADLAENLTSSSDGLRELGIQLDLVESYGHSTSVRLRALESRKKCRAETAAVAALRTREEDLPTEVQPPGPLPDVHQPEANQGDAADEITDGVGNEAVRPSAFERILAALIPSQLRSMRASLTSRPHHAVLALLLSIAALGLALTIPHAVKRRAPSSDIPLTAVKPAPPKPTGGVRQDAGTKVTARGRTNVTPSGKQSSDATSQLLRAARSGDANAQLQLGTAYATGRGAPADAVTAYTWLTLAFANGNSQAEDLIRELTRRLGSADIARIRWNVGQMYADGIGVPQDNVTAYMWHLLAETSGEMRSRVAKERLARSMTPDQKSEAQMRAADWLRKHHQDANKTNSPAGLN